VGGHPWVLLIGWAPGHWTRNRRVLFPVSILWATVTFRILPDARLVSIDRWVCTGANEVLAVLTVLVVLAIPDWPR
jgi:hypothetical protein